MEFVFIAIGAIGLLYEFAASFQRAYMKLDKHIKSQRCKPKIIRYEP